MADEDLVQRPTLAYAHLCDYAAIGSGGKPIAVGIFDRLDLRQPGEPIRLPLSFLLASITASIATGTEHRVAVVVQDADEGEVMRIEFGAVRFAMSGPGRPLGTCLIVQLSGLPLPATGDYAFRIVVDGESVGEATLSIVEAPAVS